VIMKGWIYQTGLRL